MQYGQNLFDDYTSFSAEWLVIKMLEKEDDTMVPEIETAYYKLLNNFVILKNIIAKIDQDGKHRKTYWKREVKKALMWLLR